MSVAAAVDVHGHPSGALSPSRAADFMSCPLKYRFRVIDRLPEKPSSAAVRGTVVHAVLERLFDLPRGERTLEHAAEMIEPQWQQLLEAEPEVAELFAEDADGAELAKWLAEAHQLLGKYFTLEDPNLLEPAERELYVETILDSPRTGVARVGFDFWQQFDAAERLEEIRKFRPSAYKALPEIQNSEFGIPNA